MKKLKKSYWIIGALFILTLFAFITKQTPLAGDDWGYALNGLKGNPFQMAIDFYFSWSGRFFSELWGFLIAPNKWVWDILNPIFFTVIFVCSYYLIKPKKNQLVIVLVIIAVMLSVDDNLRMETYTWIMGTTLVIPLMLSLIYFVIISRMDGNIIGRMESVIWLGVSSACLMYIGLAYENIAAGMIFAVIVLIIYNYFIKHIELKFLVVNLIVSLGSFIIMRMSPGSSSRLLLEHEDWNKLSLFGKISDGYPKFIEFIFLNNNYLIMILSLSLLFLLWTNRKKVSFKHNKLFAIISSIVCGLSIICAFGFIIPNMTMFTDRTSLFNSLFWPIYTIIVFMIMYFYLDENRDRALLFFMIAGTCGMVMMYSPIFGSRNALYTVYFIIICIGLIFVEINFSILIQLLLVVFFGFIIYDRTSEYIMKYQKVQEIHEERLGEIEYYRHNYELEEGWITRMPPFTVHGADIEQDDPYHMETFKEYYGLNPKIRLNFGWKESYD